MHVETTVLFEEAFCFGTLDIMATFRAEIEQRPGHKWTVEKIEAKQQDGSWQRVSPYHPLRSFFESYAYLCKEEVENAIQDTLHASVDRAAYDGADRAKADRFEVA